MEQREQGCSDIAIGVIVAVLLIVFAIFAAYAIMSAEANIIR